MTNLKGEIDRHTITVGDFNTQVSIMDRKSKQKISKEIIDSNNTISQMYIADIYRTPDSTGYTFFSSTHRTFSGINHIIGHKTSLNNLTR